MTERTLEAEAAKALSLDEVRLCIALLQAIVADRALLADIPAPERQALILAAGRASRPARHEATRLVKEFRRRKKRQAQDDDRETRATTGIRTARQASVFVAPAPARIAARPQGGPEAAEGPTLRKPKSCYVCKTDFTRLHFFYDALCPNCAAFNCFGGHEWCGVQRRDCGHGFVHAIDRLLRVQFYSSGDLLGTCFTARRRFRHADQWLSDERSG